ncbi:MAG: hypothetical protein H8E11_05445, partial [Candidatus Cloacimonetes bacterium]|nr:hypothetical protein [Candidatus Cloacimonadota bacterium]
IKELGKEKTLLISSHILQEVQAVCDRIVIINEGKIVADGSTEELKSSFQNKTKLELELKASEKELKQMTDELKNISIISITSKENKYTLTELEYESIVDRRVDIYNYIKAKDWTLLEMHRVNVSLEAVFRNLTIEGGK